MNKCHSGKCMWSLISHILLVVGGLNWGVYGASMLLGHEEPWNLVTMLLGSMPMVEAIVYVLVGLAAIVSIFGCKCAKCMSCTCTADGSTNTGSTMPQ